MVQKKSVFYLHVHTKQIFHGSCRIVAGWLRGRQRFFLRQRRYDEPRPGFSRLRASTGCRHSNASECNGNKCRKILFGTVRKLIHQKDGTIAFGSERKAQDNNYTVGYTVVTIPPNHTPGKIERSSVWKLQFHENPERDMIEKNIVKLSNAGFDSLLSNASNGSDAFIFIHGYNNSFEDAALRTAQLAKDINLPVAPIMFIWASDGKSSDYIGDAENATRAIPAFIGFLKRVAQQCSFQRIHLIAHSMGNRLISLALFQLANDPVNLKIDQVIMAAPDVYADEFKLTYAESVLKRAKRVTVYAANNDWALLTSQKLSKHLRLGQVGLPPYLIDHVDIVDASRVKTDFLGHDRFAQSVIIMQDINKLMSQNKGPLERGVPHRTESGNPYFYLMK